MQPAIPEETKPSTEETVAALRRTTHFFPHDYALGRFRANGSFGKGIEARDQSQS
jgi:hypothetical protein